MGGIRRIKSTMFRHIGGGGRAGLAELRSQREAGKELRDEDAAEKSKDQPPRNRPSWRWVRQQKEAAAAAATAAGESVPLSRHMTEYDGTPVQMSAYEQHVVDWHAKAGERVIKRLNNVYRLRDERKGILPELPVEQVVGDPEEDAA